MFADMTDSHVTRGFLQGLFQKIEQLEAELGLKDRTIDEMLKVHHKRIRELVAELELEKSQNSRQ